MDKHPEISTEDLLNAYLSWISAATVEDSCINQTASGCALPRELRSDICNGFYCDPVKLYQKKLSGKNELGVVLAIQRSSTYWNRFDLGVNNEIVQTALIQEDALQILNVDNES